MWASFTYSRTRGDHATYNRRIEGEPTRVVVVVLAKREVACGTLRSILRQAGLSVEEFIALL